MFTEIVSFPEDNEKHTDYDVEKKWLEIWAIYNCNLRGTSRI